MQTVLYNVYCSWLLIDFVLGQPHEGSSYAASKDLTLAYHRIDHIKSRLATLERFHHELSPQKPHAKTLQMSDSWISCDSYRNVIDDAQCPYMCCLGRIQETDKSLSKILIFLKNNKNACKCDLCEV